MLQSGFFSAFKDFLFKQMRINFKCFKYFKIFLKTYSLGFKKRKKDEATTGKRGLGELPEQKVELCLI